MKPRWWMPTIALFVAIGLGGIYVRGGEEPEEAAPTLAGAALVGSVADVKGRPIARARVRIDGVTGESVTDGHGRFRIGPVAAGVHVVRVTAAGYADNEQTVEVPGDAAQVEVAFRLPLD